MVTTISCGVYSELLREKPLQEGKCPLAPPVSTDYRLKNRAGTTESD